MRQPQQTANAIGNRIAIDTRRHRQFDSQADLFRGAADATQRAVRNQHVVVLGKAEEAAARFHHADDFHPFATDLDESTDRIFRQPQRLARAVAQDADETATQFVRRRQKAPDRGEGIVDILIAVRGAEQAAERHPGTSVNLLETASQSCQRRNRLDAVHALDEQLQIRRRQTRNLASQRGLEVHRRFRAHRKIVAAKFVAFRRDGCLHALHERDHRHHRARADSDAKGREGAAKRMCRDGFQRRAQTLHEHEHRRFAYAADLRPAWPSLPIGAWILPSTSSTTRRQ